MRIVTYPVDRATPRQDDTCERWILQYADGYEVSGATRDEWAAQSCGDVVQLRIQWPQARGLADGITKYVPYYLWPKSMDYPVHSWEAMAEARVLQRIKFGAWVHRDILEWAQACGACDRQAPVSAWLWSLYYENGTRYTNEDGAWDAAPLDRVVLACGRTGAALYQCDYYFWQEGQLQSSNDWSLALRHACPEIKHGVPVLP